MSRIYKQSTISPAIPGYTAGAGKCIRCDLPAEWMQSWIEYRHGNKKFHWDNTAESATRGKV